MLPATPLSTLAFRLLIAGSIAEGQLATRLAHLNLKPKHVSLLSALRLGAPGSQAELAELLGIAPSLVVVFADHLEGLGAITRERDPADRRRQQLILTTEGERLVDASVRICEQIDIQLQQHVPSSERAAVDAFLARIVATAGVPVDELTEGESAPVDGGGSV